MVVFLRPLVFSHCLQSNHDLVLQWHGQVARFNHFRAETAQLFVTGLCNLLQSFPTFKSAAAPKLLQLGGFLDSISGRSAKHLSSPSDNLKSRGREKGHINRLCSSTNTFQETKTTSSEAPVKRNNMSDFRHKSEQGQVILVQLRWRESKGVSK